MPGWWSALPPKRTLIGVGRMSASKTSSSPVAYGTTRLRDAEAAGGNCAQREVVSRGKKFAALASDDPIGTSGTTR